jgi:predicted nuclease of predicted toxin-antitoxin system
MMRFKIDENLPVEVAELLRGAGHDALTVLDQKMGGHPDRAIGDTIRVEKRALITLDFDFADIRTFPPGDYAGLIVLRLAVQDKPSVLALIARVIPLLNNEPLVGMLWVVDETALRIRGERA